VLSVIQDPSITYPEASEYFSPSERFPEYRYAHVSTRENRVYEAVRNCFIQMGLDSEHLGTPTWNPLGGFIKPGNRVFLLCNFAHERGPKEPLEDFRSRCSHGSVIRALLDYILIAAGENGCIRLGNAATQHCHWEAVLRDTEARAVVDFYQSVGVSVQATDLRFLVVDAAWLGYVRGVERRDETDGVHVRLDHESLFTELDRAQPNRYRVMNYDPRRIESFHSNQHHEYVINRHILESDVIFSTPKLKTHEKVGISCALKGMVGIVGHKDSLPHHRYGSPKQGGDEYPAGKAGLMPLVSAVHEQVEKTRPETYLGSALRVGYKVFRRSLRTGDPVVDGAWWGNDTAWRMVLDLARIATYANVNGEMQKSACRKHIVLTDGIIGGEGEGPSNSTAVRSGILTFSDDLVAADHVNARLMGFDPEKIPMLREAARLEKYRLLKSDLRSQRVIFNGEPLTMEELARLERAQYEPQDGWKEVLAERGRPEPA
jgi:uncharacterized protein (DUF362 family)